MAGYVIRWGAEEWSYQILPTIREEVGADERVYANKALALNDVINEMCYARRILNESIARAQKKQKNETRRAWKTTAPA